MDLLARRPVPGWFAVVALLARREAAARLGSVWPWILASGACVLAALYGAGFVRAFETESVLVSADPLAVLDTAVAAFLALVLGLRLAASVSWEREHGTLEVLLVGPVDHAAVAVAKFLAETAVLAAVLVLYAAYLVLAQPLGAGVLEVRDLGALLVRAVMILPAMALGLLLSCLFGGVRGAVVAFFALAALLVAHEAALAVLRGAQPKDLGLALLYLRAGLEGIDVLLGPVSGVAPLADLVHSVVHRAAVPPGRIAGALVLTAGTVALAAGIMRWRRTH